LSAIANGREERLENRNQVFGIWYQGSNQATLTQIMNKNKLIVFYRQNKAKYEHG
jgi:hypothetical protein